jgi:di/tricarboxylate transporter
MGIAVVLVLLAFAILNFALEWIAIEVFSILLMATLVVARILTPQEAFQGFANSAVIMIGGVMILTGGIIQNGAADVIASRIAQLAGTSEGRMGTLLLGAVNAISAFINNVAATAMFIPVVEGMARRFGVSRGKYLIPIAFASMTGGMCTLIGTSTNVAVAGALQQYGLQPLGFFELTPVGIAVALVGMPYLLWIAPRLIGRKEDEDPERAYGLKGFLFEVVIQAGSPVADATLLKADLGGRFGLTVLAIVRGSERIVSPHGDEHLRAGDLLLVEGEARTIPAVHGAPGLEIKSMPSLDRVAMEVEHVKMMEATVSYNSPFLGRSLQEINFRHRFDLSVLAIHRRGEPLVEKVGKIPLKAGDVLLAYGREEAFDSLAQEQTMLLVESASDTKVHVRKALVASGVFLLAIIVSGLGWLDSPTAFLTGAGLVMLFRCLTAEEAGSYLNFRFLVMLAGMASLGMAMEQSGAAIFLARGIVQLLGVSQPLLLLSVFFVLTVVLTQPLNNAAAALLVLPIGIHAARDIGIDPRAFAIAITLAASCSFITPFEPACLLVYSTGHYRFRDFITAGSLLTLIAFAICLVLIPILWPFHPAA